MTENTTREFFAQHISTNFSLASADGESVELELVEATDKTPADIEGEQFSLVFRGPPQPALTQRIYTLEHPDMGKLELFLVPVGLDESGRLYEAFFNRLKGPKK